MDSLYVGEVANGSAVVVLTGGGSSKISQRVSAGYSSRKIETSMQLLLLLLSVAVV